MATGPGISADMVFTGPKCHDSCKEYLISLPRKKYSLYVSEVIDRLGYSYEMVKYRQQSAEETDIIHNRNISYGRYTLVTTGGKGEGTSLYYESDIDSMFVINDIFCSDNPHHLFHQENIILFQTESQYTTPGYTRLKLLKFGGVTYADIIKQSLFETEAGSYYLSSSFFINVAKLTFLDKKLINGLTPGPTSGPSTPVSTPYGTADEVYCFRCFCPDILERWVSRSRPHAWPSQASIHEISRLDGHVVPVGLKGSENMYTEWRICFSLAELSLMRSINDTQLKVYILMKKLSKSTMNVVCEDMTSYIMKNVVLWICESNGVDRFTPELLMDRLFDCIAYLKACVIRGNLPSYMIPERNLLAGRLSGQQREELSSLLTDLLNEGGGSLLRCHKIRDGMLSMYTNPDACREFGEKRDKVETLVLMMKSVRHATLKQGMSIKEMWQTLAQNEEYRDLQAHRDYLIQFHTQALRQSGKSKEEINHMLNTRLWQLLS